CLSSDSVITEPSLGDYSTIDELSSQVSSLSRPSAKSVYSQRKAYAASINQMMDNFQHRVEHLLTCDLDGKELRSVADCVERLKLLNEMGRVWGQNMLLEVRGASVLLSDIETKEELESMALSDILELKAVLNAGVFNSLLTVSVQPRRNKTAAVFLFQCEDIRVRTNLWKHLLLEEGYKFFFCPFLQDILNHVLSDIEIFMGQIAAVVAKTAKKKMKKKKKKGKVMAGMPSAEEFSICLRKIKYGFNLLGELNGQIKNPSAPEFVHSLFSALAFVVSHCPKDLPPTTVAPLLTPQSIRLMSEEAEAEEDQLWQSLGDAWNIPSTQWPEDDEDIPTYTPQFFDGWQPPELTPTFWAPPQPPEKARYAQTHSAIQQTEHFKAQSSKFLKCLFSSGQSKLRCMRVMDDFISRNHSELTVRKGEIVELLDMSRQWWKVRNSRREEGFIPNNVLEAVDEQPSVVRSPVLTKTSKPVEVKAWLEDEGFTKITVRCLGVLSGSMLLGMSREELKIVCPEEGGRVFLQLQAVKSTMAVSERPQSSFICLHCRCGDLSSH
uniref:SH3 domain-containing protein n=1 Tax=Monopterus albus TaxID=43700 RepID=A0A3Q3KA21_MONAL